MARFELAAAAVADLSSIWDYTLAQWGAPQASDYLDALRGRLRELAARPAMGRERRELAAGLLSFPFESHVVFYVRTEDGIAVARILHARQDPARHFDRAD